MEPWGRMVVQQLQAVGVDANLRLIEWGIFRDQTGGGQFTGAVDWDGCGSVVEPWFGMNRRLLPYKDSPEVSGRQMAESLAESNSN